MKIVAIGLALAMAGPAAVAMAQDRMAPPPGYQGGPRGAMPPRGGPPPGGPQAASQGDPMAELDQRIAEIRDTLRLNPEQHRLWAAVEDGIRGVARQREEAQRANQERSAALREARAAGQRPVRNVPEELRMRADLAAGNAEALRRLAEATAPLYDMLNEGQRRRFGLVLQTLNPGRRPPPPPQTGRNGPPRPQQGMQPPGPGGADPGEDGDPDAEGSGPEQRRPR